MLNPPAGAANVAVTLGSSSSGFVVGATSFTGVDQSAPLNGSSSNSGNSATPSVSVSSAANELVFGVVAFQNTATLTAAANQTQQWSAIDTGNTIRGAASTAAGATATVTMSWSQSGGASSAWAAAALSIRPAPTADVIVVMSGASTIIAGANLTYTIGVTNLGPFTATNVVVTDALPSGSTFVSASTGGTHNSGTVTWNVGALASTAKTNLTLTITSPKAAGSLTNTISATSNTLDSDPTNNDGSAAASRVITALTAGPISKLQLLMPGETAAPGIVTGKSGSASGQIVGVPFNVSVKAVDANWNLVSSTDTVALTSSDTLATLPANTALVAGAAILSVTFGSAGNQTVTVSDVTAPGVTGNTGSTTAVAKGSQTITFAAIPNQARTNTFILLASSSSGLPVTFAVTSGAASIANGTNLTFSAAGDVTITASQAGNANWNAAADVARSFSVNSLPIPSSPTVVRWPLGNLKVRAPDLLGSDADGDVLTLSSAIATSAQSGTVVIDGGWVFYTRPAGFTNADSFSYVVSDTRGGSNSGTCTINITSDANATDNYTVTDLGNGSVQINFSGIPGRSYALYYSESSGPLSWSQLATTTAGSDGEFISLDNPTSGANSRVYRAVEVIP